MSCNSAEGLQTNSHSSECKEIKFKGFFFDRSGKNTAYDASITPGIFSEAFVTGFLFW